MQMGEISDLLIANAMYAMISTAIILVNTSWGTNMKVSKQQSAENRKALVKAADRLIRERGFDGVGVAEVCKQAGLTHGALYAHFPDKQALAVEALAYGSHAGFERLMSTPDEKPPTVANFLDYYLSSETRDDVAIGCPMAASTSEIGRQGQQMSEVFSAALEQLVGGVNPTLGPTSLNLSDRERTLTVVAALMGGVALARGTAKGDPALSDEILSALRKVLGQLAGERTAKRKR